ncbi:putative phage tail protein [Candidatus Rhodobacter oscarellae]|uniref:Putative phage tail protein n=1 Tax=Candidatus Rhodobacter oscarellae TaxID=1675527 RepID=A0A0J9E673_9RHOB|nr:putative phage tail protein [Candidatus Rhodobacter lobularis]
MAIEGAEIPTPEDALEESDDIVETTLLLGEEHATGEAAEAETEAEPVEDPEAPQDIPEPDHDAPQAAPAPVAPVTEVQRVGFFQLVLGGVIAAGLGAGVLYFGNQQGWISLGGSSSADLSALQDQLGQSQSEIAALRDALAAEQSTRAEAIAALQAGADLTELQAALEAQGAADADTGAAVQELAAGLAETRAQLAELALQPIPEAQLPQEVAQAYEKQLADILATIEGRFATMQASQTEAMAQIETDLGAQLAVIEAAQAEALASEQAAQKAAERLAAEAALAQVQAALDAGTGFAAPLATFGQKSGIAAPAALTAVASEGAPSLGALQEAFPEAARAALNVASREAAGDGSGSPLASFIMAQLGARSLEPRAGSDPDAVLSRAEGALGQGDLPGALAELEALPDAAKTLFADWIAQATALGEAKSAAAALAAQLNEQ